MAGRPIQIRASYVQDAQYIARIARAVEMDKVRPAEWRRKVLMHLEEISTLFMGAREPENQTRRDEE